MWVKFQDLSRFVDTFMPTEEDLKHAPKIIRVAWSHEIDLSQKEPWNITPLLRLFAYRPDFYFEFIPYRLALGLMPDDNDLCDFCMTRIDEDVTDEENPYGFCECMKVDIDYKDWEIGQYDDMSYMDGVQSVIENKNMIWLDAVRNGDITVEIILQGASGRVTVLIQCKNSFCLDKNYRKGAWVLLHKWDLLGPLNGSPSSRDYVFTFESKKVVISHSGRYETTDTITREVIITKIE